MTDKIEVTQADLEFAANWNANCRWCSEYDGDFAADFVRALVPYRIAAQERAALAMREAAVVAMDNLCFFTDVSQLLEMTKQEMSVRTCLEGAKAIRAIDPAQILKEPSQ